MGLVQREIEAAGLATITLSSIPDLTAAVSVPRLVAIEHPLGLPFGQPGDVAGQTTVLLGVLDALKDIPSPGDRIDLPFEWPEPPKQARREPPEPPPIVGHLMRHPWQIHRLLNRDVPREG